jgi:hypothetical protein
MNNLFNKVFGKLNVLVDRFSSVFSILVFVAILFQFGYIGLVNSPPQSTHVWRQSDCASLAINYYENGMDFFSPQIHNLHANNGTTGNAISECPYLYYTVAGLYKIFGHQYWVYRSAWTIIMIFGFYALFSFFSLIINSKPLAFLGAVLVLSSPVIVYYGNNFLPDVPALIFSIIGWMFFAKWLKSKNYYHLILVALFFMLGGLLKVTALISFFSLAGIWLLEWFGLKFGHNKTMVFKDRWREVVPFALAFLVVVAWYIWAWNYNSLHETKYFSMRTCPIWNVSGCCYSCNVVDIFRQIRILWLPHLLSKPMILFLAGCALSAALFIRYSNRLLVAISAFTFFGSLMYMLIWFAAFQEHDYYFINLYIFPIFLILTAFDALKNRFSNQFASPYVLILLIILAIYSVFYTSKKQSVRYRGWMNDYKDRFSELLQIAPLIDELGIDKNDLIVSLPDATPNYSLYMLNRRGWTSFYGQSNDSTKLVRHIENGAKFLFISTRLKVVEQNPYLKSFMGNPVGEYNELGVYRLDGYSHPKQLQQHSDTLFHLFCDAEKVNELDKELLQTSQPKIFCKGASYRDTTLSKSGKYSVLVNKDQHYGFTTAIPIFENSTVTAKVWRNSLSKSGFLVVSSGGEQGIYYSENKGVLNDDTGWEEISISITIDSRISTKSLSVYVWNESNELAFFDDFEVVVEKKGFVILDAKSN